MKTNFHKAIFFAAAVMLANTVNVNAQSTTSGAAGNNYLSTSFLGWGTTSGDLQFKVNNATKMLIQNNTGNVGIGTTTPYAPLNVAGTNANPTASMPANGALFVGSTATGLALTMGVFSNGGINPLSWIQSRHQTAANTYYALALNPLGGNVGIGTTTPLEALQIGDRFTLHNGGFKGFCYNFTYNGGDKRILADYASGIFLTNSGTILFRTAPTGAAGSAISWLNNMTIGNDGKILIGNPALANFQGTPGSYLLYVQQGILTEKVKVAVATTADWSDYVFENGYKLKSVSELEAFVKENKHLPNVPSAEEVVKEGVDMAKMDAKLLEKIEELTLYMIQQDKKINELSTVNQKLVQQVASLEKK